ncbi:glycosyltransferase family 2 protein [candidate division KSB1 bacterium]|nr:glycosyltransferase family 2 protein [candidate division KSB1 bacterium]
MEKRLTVCIPAYNEETSLQQFLPVVIDHCLQRDYDILLVNDGSSDRTAEIADKLLSPHHFHIINHKINRGYGAAIKTGIMAVVTEYIATIDADGQHSLEDVDMLYAIICENDADMVVGDRRGQAPRNVYRTLGKILIRGFAKLLMRVPIYDINSGMKVYRAELAKRYIPLCPDAMPFSEIITLIFIYNKHNVIEYPIRISTRKGGISSVNTRTAFQTVMEIVNMLVLFNPLRIFLPIAILSIFLGFAWGIPLVIKGRGVSVGSMLGIVAGLIFFFLGLIAEQLSLIRLWQVLSKESEKTQGKHKE